jgi:uncharacterized lipoprotein
VKHRLILSVVVALLAGCSSLQTPTGVVTAVRPTAATAEGARVEVTVELINPNDIPLPLLRTDYTVTLEGVGTFTFHDPTDRTLPAGGTQAVVLPAAFAKDGGQVGGVPYRVTGNITYEPPGEVRKVLTESGIPLPTVSFAASGRLE